MSSDHSIKSDTKCIILAFVAVFVQIVSVKVFKYFFGDAFAEGTLTNGVIDILLTLVSTAFPTVIFLIFGERKKYFSSKREFEVKRAVIYLLWALGLGYTFRIVFFSVTSLLSFFDSGAVNGAGISVAVSYFVSAVVIPSVFEEVFYRGILIDLFERFKGGVVITAMLFAVSHNGIVSMVNAFVFGLLIGYVYKRTRSIYYCITIHFINNLIAFCGVIANNGDVLYYAAKYLPYIIAICGICLVIISMVRKRDIFR